MGMLANRTKGIATVGGGRQGERQHAWSVAHKQPLAGMREAMQKMGQVLVMEGNNGPR